MSDEPIPNPRRWVGTADAVFIILALGILLSARHSMLDDPGLGWHLRNIDAMWQQRGWLEVDPFSRPATGTSATWYTNQWIGDAVLRLGEWCGGLEGIVVVTTLVLAATFRTLYQMLLADGLAWPMAALWTYLAALGTSSSWVARPNFFSIAFTLLIARWCQHQDNRPRGWQVGRVFLLFVVWANTHGGFVAGLMILGASIALEAAVAFTGDDPQQRTAARTRTKELVLWSIAALVGTLVNPYGWKLYPWVFKLLGDSYFMSLHTEWQSPDFHALGAFRIELLILLLPLLLAVTSRRPQPVELGLALLWLHFGLNGRRYLPLWVMVATPLLAKSSVRIAWIENFRRSLPLSPELRTWLGPQTGVPQPWKLSVAFAAGLLAWSAAADGVFQHNPKFIPSAALDFVIRSHNGRAVFHDYNWGGYLIWKGWPALKNWIDDRNEVQGRAHVEEFFAILFTKPRWEERLDPFQIVCIKPETPLAYRLAEQADWHETYRDPHAVVFEKR